MGLLQREQVNYHWVLLTFDLPVYGRPDTQKFLEKKEKEEREKREGKDDRSFFQKYVRQSQYIISHSSHSSSLTISGCIF